jgi:predicted dehydrogenase
MASGQLNMTPLLTDRFKFSDAQEAYEKLTNDHNALGIILEYSDGGWKDRRACPERSEGMERSNFPVFQYSGSSVANHVVQLAQEKKSASTSKVVVGVIGAGQFTKLMLLPALKKAEVRFRGIASAGGVSGTHLGKKFGFEQTTTDYQLLLSDETINTIFITTRNNQHAKMVVEALEGGKHVFVEKPLAINREGLEAVRKAYQAAKERAGVEVQPLLMVGFNRRFAPQVIKIRDLLKHRADPLMITMLVNAGAIPPDHWTQDASVGGGRIIGEACHFLDLLAFIAEAPIIRVSATVMGGVSGSLRSEDTMSITLRFADGSVGTVHYFSNGHRGYPKERLEVFSEGKILSLNNFRWLSGYGWKGFRRMNLWRQDKGHFAEIQTFIDHIASGGEPLIPFEQLYNVTLATFAAVESAKTSHTVELSHPRLP